MRACTHTSAHMCCGKRIACPVVAIAATIHINTAILRHCISSGAATTTTSSHNSLEFAWLVVACVVIFSVFYFFCSSMRMPHPLCHDRPVCCPNALCRRSYHLAWRSEAYFLVGSNCSRRQLTWLPLGCGNTPITWLITFVTHFAGFVVVCVAYCCVAFCVVSCNCCSSFGLLHIVLFRCHCFCNFFFCVTVVAT